VKQRLEEPVAHLDRLAVRLQVGARAQQVLELVRRVDQQLAEALPVLVEVQLVRGYLAETLRQAQVQDPDEV
jgi:hypothetical protein